MKTLNPQASFLLSSHRSEAERRPGPALLPPSPLNHGDAGEAPQATLKAAGESETPRGAVNPQPQSQRWWQDVNTGHTFSESSQTPWQGAAWYLALLNLQFNSALKRGPDERPV